MLIEAAVALLVVGVTLVTSGWLYRRHQHLTTTGAPGFREWLEHYGMVPLVASTLVTLAIGRVAEHLMDRIFQPLLTALVGVTKPVAHDRVPWYVHAVTTTVVVLGSCICLMLFVAGVYLAVGGRLPLVPPPSHLMHRPTW
jgi:hypothetical protein